MALDLNVNLLSAEKMNESPDMSAGQIAITLLAVGGATAIAGSLAASRRVVRTAFRPDIWRIRETIIAGCGVAVAALAVASWQLGDESGAGPASLVAFLFCGVLAIFPVLVGRTR